MIELNGTPDTYIAGMMDAARIVRGRKGKYTLEQTANYLEALCTSQSSPLLASVKATLKTHIPEPAVPSVPAEPAQVCRNPNHALTDGTVEPHDIGPSCMAEPRSAEQLTTAANELLRELNKRVFNDAIDITKLHIAVGLCEDFAEAHATILHEFSENAVELASSRKLEIDSLREQLAAEENAVAQFAKKLTRVEEQLTAAEREHRTLRDNYLGVLKLKNDAEAALAAAERKNAELTDYRSSVEAKIFHHYPQLVSVGKVLQDKETAEAALLSAQKEIERITEISIAVAKGGQERIDELETAITATQEEIEKIRNICENHNPTYKTRIEQILRITARAALAQEKKV